MENTTEQLQNKIVFFALTGVNIQYLIIVLLLNYGEIVDLEHLGFYLFLIGGAISLTVMSIVSLNAIKNNSDRAKTIIRLALAHIPCLIGLTSFFLIGFEVI